jgi:hypothetical protein
LFMMSSSRHHRAFQQHSQTSQTDKTARRQKTIGGLGTV